MSPEEKSAKIAALKELLGYLKSPERGDLFDIFCEAVPALRNLNLSKINGKLLGETHEDVLHYIQRINPEHERSQRTKETNYDTYGKLCQIAKTTRYDLSSQDVLPYRLRKDQLEKLNYFINRIRDDSFSIGDYEDLFAHESLLKALISPEERSDFVKCIDNINVKKLLIRGTPAQPNPVQTKDEQGGREIDDKGPSSQLISKEVSIVHSKFQDETTPHKTIQPDQVVRKQRIDLENAMDKTFTNISGHLTELITNKSTAESAPPLKSEYDTHLKKFNEILSDKNRKKIMSTLGPKQAGLPREIMTENRIRFALQQLNTDLQDLNRRSQGNILNYSKFR